MARTKQLGMRDGQAGNALHILTSASVRMLDKAVRLKCLLLFAVRSCEATGHLYTPAGARTLCGPRAQPAAQAVAATGRAVQRPRRQALQKFEGRTGGGARGIQVVIELLLHKVEAARLGQYQAVAPAPRRGASARRVCERCAAPQAARCTPEQRLPGLPLAA